MRALPLVEKESWIADRVRGANVLHVGCTDWPLTEARLQGGGLFHDRLWESAAECVGIDLDAEGIALFQQTRPEMEFHVANAETMAQVPALAAGSWDFIVAGDVVEHLDNVGQFFKSARELLGEDGQLIVSTTSAFSAKRFFWLLFTGKEQVHPDHTGYFSEATLERIAARNGFSVAEIYGFQWRNPTLKNRLAYAVSRPLLAASRGRVADEVLAVLTKQGDAP